MNNLSASDQASWYVIYTKPRQESRALEQLRNQHYTCFLPTLRIEKIRRGRVEACEEPMFPRYLFIRLSRDTSNWAAVRSTRGVNSLVAFGGQYAMLEDGWIEALRSASLNMGRTLFTPGECVSVTSGPFAGLEGIYQAPDGDARAIILIELMSQPQKLHFATEMLRKAA